MRPRLPLFFCFVGPTGFGAGVDNPVKPHSPFLKAPVDFLDQAIHLGVEGIAWVLLQDLILKLRAFGDDLIN